MIIKRLAVVTFTFLFCGLLLFPQSLADVAKKEKERRANIKKKSSKVVTNTDLKRGEREETISIIRPATPPQKKAGIIRIRKSPLQKDAPSQRASDLDQVDQIDQESYMKNFATQILNFNELVRNPELALKKPDGHFTEIPILGILDLEITAKNGPGADIAIYAKQTGVQDMMPGGKEEEGIPFEAFVYGYSQGFWYGVLGMGERGDWVAIGQGIGISSPEEFDIGSLSSIKKIRIMFSPHNNGSLPVKFYRVQSGESFFGIDAVEALHQ